MSKIYDEMMTERLARQARVRAWAAEQIAAHAAAPKTAAPKAAPAVAPEAEEAPVKHTKKNKPVSAEESVVEEAAIVVEETVEEA